MLEQALIARFVTWLHCLQLCLCAKGILAVWDHYLLLGGMLRSRPRTYSVNEKAWEILGVVEILEILLPCCILFFTRTGPQKTFLSDYLSFYKP